jgi:predicted nucleic acid-binding protein
MRPYFGKPNLMQTDTGKYFLHTSVFLRHASGDSGEAEEQIETILTKAVVAKHRVWISSILFAELRPSVFIPGRFATLFELTRYLRSLATFVTPDPNIMLRAARLRDVKWQRPQKSMSLGDAIQIASALWVKEALGVRDLEFLLIDKRSADEAGGGVCTSTVRLQDYAHNAHTDSDAKAARRALAQLDARR